MKLLATCKANGYDHRGHSYGTLVEIDWSSRKVLRHLRLPTASFHARDAYMAPSANGVCVADGRIFVAMWNHIVVIDPQSFTVVDAFSDPWMADLHGLATDGLHLFVAATATETVLCYRLSDRSLAWRWGPHEPILETGAPHWPPRALARTVRRRRTADEGEFRMVHKTRSPFRRHHLNDVRIHAGALHVTTHRWFDQVGGAIIRLDPATQHAEFAAPPGSFPGMHDGELVDGRIIVTESGANAIGELRPDGTVHHHPMEPSPYYVRGLCQGPTPGESVLVGCSPTRRSPLPTLIVELDRTFTREIARMDLSDLYPSSHGTAVHALLRLG